MKKLLLLLITIVSLNAKSQALTCEDFIEGTFIVTLPKFPGVEWKIIRSADNQTEMISKCPEKYIQMGFPVDTVFGKVRKTEKCIYHLRYDENKMALNDFHKYVNEMGGIKTEILKIEGDCCFFVSTYYQDNKEVKFEGKMCKIE